MLVVEAKINQQDGSFEKSEAGLKAREYVEAERLQIYERLRASPHDDLYNFYMYFGIQSNDAMKKTQLANAICKWEFSVFA